MFKEEVNKIYQRWQPLCNNSAMCLPDPIPLLGSYSAPLTSTLLPHSCTNKDFFKILKALNCTRDV